MKVVYSAFAAIFLFIYSGSNLVGAKNIFSFHSDFFESKDKVASISVYLSSGLKFTHSDTSEKPPVKLKKRNKKGIKPLLFGVFDEFRYTSAFSHSAGFLLKRIPYAFLPFQGNGKRGPPVC